MNQCVSDTLHNMVMNIDTRSIDNLFFKSQHKGSLSIT